MVCGSAGVALDGQGNVGFFVSGGYGYGSPSASIEIIESSSNAPSIKYLNGESYQWGGSVSLGPCSVGAEYSLFYDPNTYEAYDGYTVSVGVGPSPVVEVHGTVAYTEVYYFNIWAPIYEAYDKILNEW